MSDKKNNIILIGFMGSGKTTFGKWIANKYGMKFCDTDEYIENTEQRTINDIFAKDGEEFFRNLETATIEKLCGELENAVISVGGGLPVRKINRELLKKLGLVVYLNTSTDDLVKRLSKDTKRPLLKGADIRTRITTLMEQREDLYKEASDIIIETDGHSFEDMYALIKAARREK